VRSKAISNVSTAAGMSTVTTMVQPPRPPPPPGPPSNGHRAHRPHPPRSRPPPPRARPPAPRARPPATERPVAHPRPPPTDERPVKMPRLSNGRVVKIMKPTVLRDVAVYDKMHQLGKGTFGDVFMGADKQTKEIVALKMINTQQEANYGFPITTIREVKILKALNHPNIVKLKEIVTSKEQNSIPKSVYLVFEYHEYDLTGILGTRDIRLTQDHIKSWSMQLLQGVHYMHVNQIIHRDLKSANILIGKNGELKIADWGLARTWNEKMEKLTNPVITLWYRPPELLLGSKKYSPKIDMWSVGCIIAEMFRRSSLLTGSNEASQIDLIFKTLGHPTVEEFPSIHEVCPQWSKHAPQTKEQTLKNRLSETLKSRLPNPRWVTDNAIDLVQNLLAYDPAKRWDAKTACARSEYFYEEPCFKPASELSMKFGVKAAHEWGLPSRQAAEREMQRRRMNGSKGAKPAPPAGKPRPPT